MVDKLFAVPTDEQSFSREEGVVYLNVDKEVLKNALGFDKDNWPISTDRQWINQVNRVEQR